MSEYNSEDILTCALTGHGTVGKTILADTMLYNAGIINRIGSIEGGSTTSDYRDDEINRQISIHGRVIWLQIERFDQIGFQRVSPRIL